VVGGGVAVADLTRLDVPAAAVRFMGGAARRDACSSLHLTLYALFASEGYVARVIVDVMLKPEIHDPQGEAVLSASHRLGFGNVTAVRQGKRFELELDGPSDDATLAAAEEIARELLANPVIEEFSLHITE
jgi:phosphoribosylformylglycinamidine synthase